VDLLRGLDLFSGIGGIGKALEPWVSPVAYCENDRFCQSVLLSRMSTGDIIRAPIWDDVTTLRGDMLPRIDIIYGGFPCQDISCAGAGKGLAGERSGLVFEIFRLLDETKASIVFLENVPAIRTRGAETVCKELAKRGYDCRWCNLSASDVGALHRRTRWFLMAYSDSKSSPRLSSREKKTLSEPLLQGESAALAYSDGWQWRCGEEPECKGSEASTRSKDMAYSDSVREPQQEGGKQNKQGWIGDGGEDVPNANSSGLQEEGQPFPCFDCNTQEWQEAVSTMDPLADGIPNYVASIRAVGNSVVPLQVREAFKMLLGLE